MADISQKPSRGETYSRAYIVYKSRGTAAAKQIRQLTQLAPVEWLVDSAQFEYEYSMYAVLVGSSATLPLRDYGRVARYRLETGGDGSNWRLHCEDGSEAGLAFRNALVGLRSFGQGIGLNYRFNFSVGYVIQGFVEIFGPILLAANDLDALEEQIDQGDRKRFRVGTHNDEPAVRAQTLNTVHHGFRRVGGAEDDVSAARCGKTLSVADNFIRAELANHLVLIGRVRNRDGLEARSF